MSKSQIKKTNQPTAKPANWPKIAAAGLVGAFVVIATIIFFDPSPPAPSSLEIIESASSALSRGDFERAESFAASIKSGDSTYSRSRLIAGEAATKSGHIDRALSYYAQVESGNSDFVTALYAQAEVLRTICQWDSAVSNYRKVLDLDPNHLDCRERLAFILGASGQRWQSTPHFLYLLKNKRWSLESLAIFTDVERPIEQVDLIEFCESNQPTDSLIKLASASQKTIDGKIIDARAILDRLLQVDPDMLTAREQLGQNLLLLNDNESLKTWHRALPSSSEQSATIWYVRSQMARAAGNFQLAAGCLCKALLIAPEHRQACYQLGQALAKLHAPNADEIIKRAELQLVMSQQLDKILASHGNDEESMKLVAKGCLDLGRYWEAWAWATTAGSLHKKADWTVSIGQASEKQLNSSLPRTLPSEQVVTKYNLQDWLKYAEPSEIDKLVFPTQLAANESEGGPTSASNLRFDKGEAVGLNFIYENGGDLRTPGNRMFEQTGGGVGVVDYDNDGWPDLYFTQGSPWLTGDDSPKTDPAVHDSLFRNLQGRSFTDVAILSGINELNYSQGLAVGDFNLDGFDDLLIGNIGLNRLFTNNGDGTFSDTTESLKVNDPSWTTSCVIADLNNDGLPDIYCVKYVQGKDVYKLICNGKGCSPTVFDGVPNQCWLNNGEGGFRLVEKADGEQRFSKSLGVVAFRLEGESLLSLLVANDQVRNFLLTVQPSDDGSLELVDEALFRGIALSVDGLAFASMGVAVDDADNNGTVDLFITNFADESDILFLQDRSGLFVDNTTATGIQAASYPYVGWGTQFLDVDRDGWSDLVVTNGHIDDYTDEGKGYQMAPQLYRNLGRGRFELVTAEKAGEYFSEKYLGRGLAKLDWNKDGLFDFAVSNINAAARLATNASQSPGNFITLKLVGTSSAREPVGCRFTVRSGKSAWTKQLTAGDGYECSNEKSIQFGLGKLTAVDEVSVEWPSGRKDSFTNIQVNSKSLIVEGFPQPTVLD